MAPRIECTHPGLAGTRACWLPVAPLARGDHPVKVLLVDDSQAVQRSFGRLLVAVPGVEVVGCAEDVAGAIAMVDALAPDLVVLDLELRSGDRGLDVLRHVLRTHPATTVIVMSNLAWQDLRHDLPVTGAAACFDKSNEFLRARDWIAAWAVQNGRGPLPDVR